MLKRKIKIRFFLNDEFIGRVTEVPLLGYSLPPKINETILYNNKLYRVMDVIHSSIVNPKIETQKVEIFIQESPTTFSGLQQ